ncbi:hypothetical protein O9K51_09243 [Purpureocillium lavendulum]|uniref:Uncharacterized protein n=1 Tax=Purpureocillium lavendulum TaxID=1247861 RepID=A0AB34FI56_9HYPO|nr:hypothetical protein O9K51_09243 [Purpureocillium lavendulum]
MPDRIETQWPPPHGLAIAFAWLSAPLCAQAPLKPPPDQAEFRKPAHDWWLVSLTLKGQT